MSGLDNWLKQATRQLSKDSATQVRREIQEHYDSALEAAVSDGASAEEADRLAITALGDAKAANCQYRKVLLTSAEARMLSEGNWEARAMCSRAWLRWLPAIALAVAAALFVTGGVEGARVLFVAGIGMGLMFAAPLLPVYTQSRGRIFRFVKWGVLSGAFLVLFGPDTPKFFWLAITCLWPLAWMEWTRASIRRKIPVAQWPKQLYL